MIQPIPNFETAVSDAVEKWNKLTPRQREFVTLTGRGKTTKQIAYASCLSVKTAETHRAHVMQRIGADSFIDVARLALILEFAGLLPVEGAVQA